MINSIFDVIGAILLCLGAIVFIFELIGVTRYKFVLNRMHAAGMGDTLGILLCMLGLICINGVNFTSLKFALVVVFLWFTSPTSSHLISNLESLTDDELKKNVDVQVENVEEYLDCRIDSDDNDKGGEG